MRALLVFVFGLIAALVVPVVAPFALEAVAQQPYYQSAGKNLSANLKVDALGGRMVTLSETITQIITCNDQGKLFDGTGCVAPGGSSLNISCGAGEVLRGISNGVADCRPLPVAAPASSTMTVPACSETQTVVVKNGALACAENVLYESPWVSVTQALTEVTSPVDLSHFRNVALKFKSAACGAPSVVTSAPASSVHYVERTSVGNRSQRMGWTTAVVGNTLQLRLYPDGYGLWPSLPVDNCISNGYSVLSGTQVKFVVY